MDDRRLRIGDFYLRLVGGLSLKSVYFIEAPNMKPLLSTFSTTATPEQVWAVASDFTNAVQNITAITKIEILTPAPIGSGTRFREWRGNQVADMEIAAWSPPQSYSLRGYAMGTEFVSEIRCVPEGTGTRLEMEIQIRPQTLGAKLFSPLISLMSKFMVKTCTKDLQDIAKTAESRRNSI
jgi:carbon monoxide dehydrogenase subunit G